jgi:hypothetical protein
MLAETCSVGFQFGTCLFTVLGYSTEIFLENTVGQVRMRAVGLQPLIPHSGWSRTKYSTGTVRTVHDWYCMYSEYYRTARVGSLGAFDGAIWEAFVKLALTSNHHGGR